MKKTLKITGLAIALALTSALASAAENIAFINSAYLLQNHPEREVVVKKLNEEFKPVEEKLQKQEKVILEKRKAFEAESKNKKARPSDLKKREAELNKLIQQFQTDLAQAQQKNQIREQEETAKIIENVRGVINNLAKEKGYTLVLDANSVVFGDGKDISDEVLKALKAK